MLLQDARLIVLDEPFNAIDAKTSADLLALVKRWHGEGRTVLAALHDMDLVRANFPETLLLARGPVAWGADRASVDRRKPHRGAADVRGVRRDGDRLRRGRQAVAGRLMLYDALIAPFTEFEFMRRALAAVIALALGAAPIGVFLMLRRMSLVGDAMAHAILPGAAIGFLVSGLNLFAMTTGGLIAGFTVALLAGLVARHTELKEDASLATFYLVSLALGVTIVSVKGTNIDLLHVLFGNILAMDDQTLLVIAFNATITLLVMAVIFRPLVIECVDPVFLRTVSRAGAPAHLAFLALVVINLVNGFHALGTLLGVGLMILPAGHRAVLVARHHRHDLHRGRKRDCLGLCRAGAVVPDQDSFGAGDHPGRGSALCGLAVVRSRQRPGPADVPRPSPRGVAMIRFWLIVLTLIAAVGPARAAERLNVVASFSILGDFVRNVGGNRVNVTTLVGPDSDAHVYAPTPADAKKVAGARLVFVNGLGFEGWLPRLVKSAGGKASVVTTTSGIAPLKLGPEADPHAWQSVANAKIYVANIRDALAAAAPADAEAFKSNAGAYLADLDALEREVREAMAKIPEMRRKVISTHNAFGYFAAAYGVEFIAPLGVSTESEASARDIARIITQIRAAKIPAVFLENISDPRLMGRISAETGARVGGTLYSDSLTAEKGDSPTYIAMVRHNIKALTSALSP